jgi:hypothetical protein
MPPLQEPDFPPGHPARCDYAPASPEAQEWARLHIFPKGERDFPPGHPKAVDTPGNRNAVAILPGIDPDRPDYEEFTGRSPEQAAAAREVYAELSKAASASPVLLPTIALNPPAAVNERRCEPLADGSGYVIFCPGCGVLHKFDARWQFNGSLELPTFTPSLLIEDAVQNIVCHSIVTNGRIQFLPDSTHRLSGQVCDLPPVAQMKETIHGTSA